MKNNSTAAVVPYNQGRGVQITTIEELLTLGKILFESGFFPDTRSVAQACVKIQGGMEMGFPPIASMSGSSIIQGKYANGANLIAAALKRAGYTWKLPQRDAHGCKLVGYLRGEEVGRTEFLEADALRAGLLNKTNWKQWPKSMYFARAITDFARTFAPEIFCGITPYTAEELGAEHTTEDGAAIQDAVVIDTGGHPVGTQAAADFVAQRKIAELKGEPMPESVSAEPPEQHESVQVPWTRYPQMIERYAEMRQALGDQIYYEQLAAYGKHHSNEFKARNEKDRLECKECYHNMEARLAKLQSEAMTETIEAGMASGDPWDEMMLEEQQPASAQPYPD